MNPNTQQTRLLPPVIPPEEMKAIRAQLKGVEGELDNAKFDVVVVSCYGIPWTG